MAIIISKRNNKYIWLISLIFILVFLSGILSPILIENENKSWEKTVVDKIDDVATSISEVFESKTNLLSSENSLLREDLRALIKKSPQNRQSLFDLISNGKYQYIPVQLYDENRNLIAWNSEPVLAGEDLDKAGSYIGQSFFVNQKLYTHLCFADTIITGKDSILIILSQPVEKRYSLSPKSDFSQNLADSLSYALSTKIEIDYSPAAQLSKDGRKYSLPIHNNFKNKIAVATFDKPSLESAVNQIQKSITIIQYLLFVALAVVVSFWFRDYFIRIKRRSLRFLIVTSILILMRIIIFVFEIPSSFVHGTLSDPSNFSSIFAFGIVRSPLELSITVVTLMAAVLLALKYSLEYSNGRMKSGVYSRFRFAAVFFLSSFLFILVLRGFGAAIRSVVFDSSIRYFKDFTLIPSPPVLLMDFNILVLGFCVIVFSVILLQFIFSAASNGPGKRMNILFISLFFLLQAASWLFDMVQKEPQGTPVIRIIFITIVFVLAYLQIILKKRNLHLMVYYAFAASIVSVSLLTYYNSQIERESLKTTAHELTRTNNDLVEFMVFQTLVQCRQDERSITSYNNNNLSADAFIIWTGSLLYREGIPSALNFFDASHNFLGGYQTGKIVPFMQVKNHLMEMKDSLKIFKEANLYNNQVTYNGIVPITENQKLLGYAVVTALYDEDYLNFTELPRLLIYQRTGISSSVDFSKLKIFHFNNNELLHSYGGVSLSPEEQKQILNSAFNSYSESWINMVINNETNLVYALKMNLPHKEKIIAIALEEKNFSWNLSDFFKVFFIHTIIISLLLIIFALTRFKNTRPVFTSYRTRLIGAFLVISLIPLIIIALYFRSLTEEKNNQLVEKRLAEMSDQVKSYISLNNTAGSLDEITVFERAARDLNINFSVFREKDLLFSSQEVYSEVGLMPAILNSAAFTNCVMGKTKRIYLNEVLENVPVNSVYSLADFDNQRLIIKIDDLFNNVSVPLSDIELDIFLFGVFSLAVLLLFILSTILADQISSPIRRLTSATRSVGSGDLNVEVNYNTSGEIKDLVDGFNMMVKKIERSQVEIAQMERESAWKEMAKQVAHEIKNPLTPMKLNVQQLIAAYKDKSPKFDLIFEKVTSTIIMQIETLKNIASEFSNFARMPRLNIEKINAVKTIREALNLFDEDKYKIEYDCPFNEIYVNADQDQLNRTIINLLRNSIQADANKISVRVDVAGNYCKILINDNGGGIKPDVISKIFDANYTTKKSGMGIGLSLAKRFVESVGGSISVEKTSDSGTTFLINLPLANNE